MGGSFGTFSGVAHQNLARLDSSGAPDATFTSPAFTVFNYRSEIFALAVQPDDKVLVGGRFSTVGGVANPSLARLNANGSLDTTFHSPFMDNGANVFAIALQPDGKILVGGDIQIIDGSNVYNDLARLNPDGSRDTTFTASTNLYGAVKTLVFIAPNQVLIGGSFASIDGQPRFGVARYILDIALATLTGNFSAGAPASYFTLSAAHFFPNSPLDVWVNGHNLGQVQAGSDGSAVFILSSASADPGAYCIRMLQSMMVPSTVVDLNTSASFWIRIDPAAPLRTKVGTQTPMPIPSGSAYQQLFLPAVLR